MHIYGNATLGIEGKEYGEGLHMSLELHPATEHEHKVLAELLKKDLGSTVANTSVRNVLRLEIRLPAPQLIEPDVVRLATLAALALEDMSDEELEDSLARADELIGRIKATLHARHPGLLARIVRSVGGPDSRPDPFSEIAPGDLTGKDAKNCGDLR